uniref:protein phosphatase methylesterase-1 n=1 Tax=Cacopsylla melanoneura TaxID=428564 RepID=A0A8D9ADH5_9HEMI
MDSAPFLRNPMSARHELNKKLKMAHSPSMRGLHQRPETDFIPETWTEYFGDSQYIETPQGRFCAYFAGSGSNTPILLCLHGAGFSGLTWAVFAKEIIQKARLRVIAIDLRGHGDTHTAVEEDLSMDTLVKDICQCVENLFKNDPVIPNIILMGHSLGGAVATCVASNPRIGGLIQALIVLDVVEGSALESLSHMTNVLQTRPKGFETIKDAIFWSCSKSQTDDFTAIRVSVPGQLKHIETGEPAKHFVCKEHEYWQELVASRSTIGNLSLDNADNTNLGQQRSAFQPVVPPPSGTCSSQYRPPFTVESQVNYAVHRGLPAVVPTYNSANLMFRTARVSPANVTNGSSTTTTGSPLRPRPIHASSEERIDENCLEEGGSQSVPDAATVLPRTMDAPASQVFRPISPARFAPTNITPSTPRRLPNPQLPAQVPSYATNLISHMPPAGPSRSSLPAIPQGNVLKFPWGGKLASPSAKPYKFSWRVNLFNTESYWQEWFTGMSDKFLDCPAKKLLILCGTDRLDTKLLRGQMQGKFQTIFIKCGHQIQEDRPGELSDEVSQFLIRHKLVEPMDS